MFEDWTLEELRGFRKALSGNLARGIRQVTYKDRTVAYSTPAEMRKALQDLTAAINGLTGAPGRTRQIRPFTSKGFER